MQFFDCFYSTVEKRHTFVWRTQLCFSGVWETVSTVAGDRASLNHNFEVLLWCCEHHFQDIVRLCNTDSALYTSPLAGDCLPGQEYSSTTQTCEQCPIGYYNDDLDPARYTCIMCNADYITASRGATSDRDCNIRESVTCACQSALNMSLLTKHVA